MAITVDVGRRLLRTVQQALARNGVASRIYLSLMGSVLRKRSDGLNKRRIVGAICGTTWPPLVFPKRLVRVSPRGRIWIVPETNDFYLTALFSSELGYEPEVFSALEERLDRYDAVVEIGANVGVFTVFFAQTAAADGRALTIYAFEPSRGTFERLGRHVALNCAAQVEIFNCAVASRTEFRPFFEPVGHRTNASLVEAFARVFTNDVERSNALCVGGEAIAPLIRRHARVLLKVDAEGSELEVLEALASTVNERLPEIVLEVLDPYAAGLNTLTFLKRYRLYNITPAGLIEYDRLVPKEHRDYLLIPRSS